MSNSIPRYLAQFGVGLVRNGYQIVPIPPGEKYPANLKDWEKTQADESTVNAWVANGRANDGVGILTTWTPAVDIDVYDDAAAQAMADWIDANIGIGKLRIGMAPKRMLVFRADAPFSKLLSGEYCIDGQTYPPGHRNAGKKIYSRIEILGAGQQFVAHAIHPETRQPYEWIDGDLLGTPRPHLDPLTWEQGRQICMAFDAMAAQYVQAGRWEAHPTHRGNYQYQGPIASPGAGFDPLDIKHPRADVSPEQIREILQRPSIIGRATDRSAWIACGMALSHQFENSPEGLELWREWSATAWNYSGDSDLEGRYAGFKNDKQARAATISTLLRWAEEDKQATIAFRLQHLEADIAKQPDYDTFLESTALNQVKSFLRDNPEKEAHVAKLIKKLPEAPRIDTLKKDIRPSRAVSRTLAMQESEAGNATFETSREGVILTTQGNVNLAVRQQGYARFAFDEFYANIYVHAPGAHSLRPLEDNDYPRLLVHLESLGFYACPKEKIKDAVAVVAQENAFDSAITWINSLQWDGVYRIGSFLSDALHIADTPYHRAVSYYIWSALAGRILAPGIKLDMVPVLVSEEGLRKSTFAEALAPTREAFGLLDMADKADDVSRKLRGKVVMEWAELKGLKGRDEESVKQFITQTHQEWIPKYKESAIVFARRCLIIGTSNDLDFLPSYGKGRRWLPVQIRREADTEFIAKHREQLYAEAVHLFRAQGIAWQGAHELSVNERDVFREEDPLKQAIEKWLNSEETDLSKVWGDGTTGPAGSDGGGGANPAAPVSKMRRDIPFKVADLMEALAYAGYRNLTAPKVARPLRELGYANTPKYYPREGRVLRLWHYSPDTDLSE